MSSPPIGGLTLGGSGRTLRRMDTKATSRADRIVQDLLLRAARTAEANAGYAEGRDQHRVVAANRAAAARLYALRDHLGYVQASLDEELQLTERAGNE